LQPEIILASQSPRRRELLGLAVKDYTVIAAEIDEEEIATALLRNRKEDFLETAKQLVMELAAKKAEVIQRDKPEALVIGADTVVVFNESILGKPRDHKEAYNMIRQLSGNIHQVLTGVCIKFRLQEDRFVSVSQIRFYPWDEQMEREVRAYVASGKANDKAGAYGIQEEAGLWVESITGDYNNIVGLPIAELNKRLKKLLYQAE
jgi:septum formation protein